MRQPSIHITEKALALAIEKVLDTQVIENKNKGSILAIRGTVLELNIDSKKKTISITNSIKLAAAILTSAKAYSLSPRSLYTQTDKLIKKANKIQSSTTEDATLLCNIICSTRKSLKHKGITQIKLDSYEGPIIREITNLANEFCSDFDLTKRSGYIEYIKIALTRMGKFALNRIPSQHSNTCLEYEAILIMQKDKYPDITKAVASRYGEKLFQETGLYDNSNKFPQRYRYFVEAAEIIKHYGIRVEDYINAQFETLAWTKNLVEPSQLVGEKAIARLNKWCYTNNVKVSKEVKNTVDWSKIRKAS